MDYEAVHWYDMQFRFSCIYVWHVNEYHRRHRPYQAHTRTTQYFIYNYYKNGNCVIETVIVMRSNERKNISVTKSTKNQGEYHSIWLEKRLPKVAFVPRDLKISDSINRDN
uniref:Uncharacterized protein n=1 Tax=Glossina palpalis gambiensis TaxID=67801 RepID=A0A1B0AWH5_9MUSC